MTHNKAKKSKILALILGLTMCLALMLGIVFASPTSTVYAEGGTPVTELTVSGLTDADVPQIGKNATMPTLTLKESGLKISTVYWFCLNTRESLKATDKFESGYTYALRLQYSVLDGYEGQITDPLKIKLDGVTTPYTVEIGTNTFINFIFNVLGNEELSLVNPERLQLADGYVGAFATTDSIHVKGGKYPYQFTNIQCPTWLPYVVMLDNGNMWKISFYGNRPTTPTPAQVLSFTVTDADGNSKTFTGTTGETKENPGAIQDIVVKYNLPDVGATSPTQADLLSAITLPENVDCTEARVFKTSGSISATSFNFEKWEKYTFRFKLKTTNGKLFAGSSLLKGYLVSNNNFSYDVSFGNVSENSLVLDFKVTKYGVSVAEQDNYKITTETLKHAKVGVLYNEKIEFTKPTGVTDSDIEIVCLDTLHGLSVNTNGTITGIPDDGAYYKFGSTITLRVRYMCKGYILDYKEYQLVVEGYTQISWPSGKTLKYNGNEQIGVEEGEEYTLSGTYKAKDIGEYTATAKLKPGYAWGAGAMYSFDDREITWKIVKGDQSAPAGITVKNASVEGKNDGKILGVTTDMEYRPYNAGSYTTCTGSTIENLYAGKYEVRYRENTNYNPSEPTIVEITNELETSEFKILTAFLPNGKCDVEYNAKIEVSCPGGDSTKVEIKNYSETSRKVWGLNLAKDGTISGKPDDRAYQYGEKNIEWRIEYYYDGVLKDDKSFFLDIDGYTVLSFVSGNQNLIYDGSEQIGVSEGEGYTLTGTTKATDAGNYVATAKLKPGYKWDAYNNSDYDVQWTIAKADKGAPVGVKGFNTSNVGVSDGKITGVTTDMEYRAVGGTYADCTGAEITGLAKGQYEVRYKESKNYKASAHVTITIAENEVITYTVTVTKGTGGGEYEEGASVTLTANTPGVGERFVGWILIGASVADTTQTEITFNMPANAVTATANYELITYNVNVEKGTATPNKPAQGVKVTITANEPEIGYKFDRWTTDSTDVSFLNATSQETTFTMPNHDVTVTATYVKATYNISVTDCVAEKGEDTVGYAYYGDVIKVTAYPAPTGKVFDTWVVTGLDTTGMDLTNPEITFNMPANAVEIKATYGEAKYKVNVTGGTVDKARAKYGETVTITATIPTGKKFVEWTSSTVLVYADKTNVTTTFTMPAGDVTVVATFEDELYRVDVTNGTTTQNIATYQTEVTVKANEPDTDMYFDKWEVTGLDTTGMDLTKTEIKFNMPAGNVTFKATYLAVTKYEIYVVDGTKDKSPAKAGETITITANPAPAGKVFDKWTCETAGVTIEFESATSSTTTFEMPASEITIQAHFRAVDDKPSVEIKVEGGTGAGMYKEGESVTITANDPAEGKVFKGWKDESGKIVSTDKSYTFKVSGEKTLTAVYDDKPSGGGEITPPAKKDGLSGGQIAGIVIGSVAVAGIGGFAIFWFAVKKKTFADLGVALKKGFTAMGNFFKTLGAKIKALFTKKK